LTILEPAYQVLRFLRLCLGEIVGGGDVELKGDWLILNTAAKDWIFRKHGTEPNSKVSITRRDVKGGSGKFSLNPYHDDDDYLFASTRRQGLDLPQAWHRAEDSTSYRDLVMVTPCDHCGGDVLSQPASISVATWRIAYDIPSPDSYGTILLCLPVA
jgi:hypothetical protein